MALVSEIVTSNGVRVRIFDDLCAGLSPDERRRRWEHHDRIKYEIARDFAARMLQKNEARARVEMDDT